MAGRARCWKFRQAHLLDSAAFGVGHAMVIDAGRTVWRDSPARKQRLQLLTRLLLKAFVISIGLVAPAMAHEPILISSDWGEITAELVDNEATRALIRMFPLTIQMRDHL